MVRVAAQLYLVAIVVRDIWLPQYDVVRAAEGPGERPGEPSSRRAGGARRRVLEGSHRGG